MRMVGFSAGALGASALAVALTQQSPAESKSAHPGAYGTPGTPPADIRSLPRFQLTEVAKHNTEEEGVWVTYKGGVYDITEFLFSHPGGKERLLMAGGQDLTPFWKIYQQHNRSHVQEFIERYRIGNLSEADGKKAEDFEFADAFANDPIRHPHLLACTRKPFCGEPRTDLLTNSFYTPNELFYVRNHLPVPDLDPREYALVVKGNGVKKHKFTLDDIKSLFPKTKIVTALQCAGNRREDMHTIEKKIFIAPHWVIGAISNAEWAGARMRDVLRYCGMDVEKVYLEADPKCNIQHVQFESYDQDECGVTYGGSVPIDKALDPHGDVLVAYEMNGRDLPRDHGYPVRALCPGHAGARSAKWLHKIIVSDIESDRTWHQKSYRGFSPDITFEKNLSHWQEGLRLDQAPIVQEMPVQSLVCNPSGNSVVAAKGMTHIMLKGVAWSGAGRGIHRVDVSIDGGKNFTCAEKLPKPIHQRRMNQWAWFLFEKKMPLSDNHKASLKRGECVDLDITSKAVNGDYNVQPERVEPYYNARGVCINHWYHVKCTLDPRATKDYIKGEQEFENLPTGGKFNYDWHRHGWTAPTENTHSGKSVRKAT